MLDNGLTRLTLSASALATLALYRYTLVAAQKEQKGPMLLGPVFWLLANTSGIARRKQYLPVERCGEDVKLAANCVPAYWRKGEECKTVLNNLSETLLLQ